VEGDSHILFQDLSLHLPRGAKKIHETPQSGEIMSELKFEQGTSQIQVRSATTQVKLLGIKIQGEHFTQS
jgi:hypothetical protein